jgi:cytochrome c-type biogenesis protein CcmH
LDARQSNKCLQIADCSPGGGLFGVYHRRLLCCILFDMNKNRIGWIAGVALFFALVTSTLTAADAPQRGQYDEDVLREARAIFNRIMSPFCPGQTLANCGSGAAEVLRSQIRQRLADGETPDEIIESIVAKYGESVRAEPPARGFARLAWIGPFALLAVGIVMVVIYLRRHTARKAARVEPRGIDPEMRARVEEELKAHRG